MATPIVLAGADLGQRHRHFNSLVADAHTTGITLKDAENLPENNPLDRLFKIDLASKLKNIDYIIRNLKDDDMLYVSRSLKAKWLLDPEYRSIINPKYLDDVLFPQMIARAISKMKHWLYINLRDPRRCAEFYEHYKEKNMDFAIKFLCNCNIQYILKEFPKILSKITPHYLKIFTEKSPEFAKIYFDAIYAEVEKVTKMEYRKNRQKYYNSIKCVLKSDPDMFLDITEKAHEYKDLGPGPTKYIVKHCKQRFMAKAELYMANLLHLPTIAKCLSAEECQQIVLRLARAKYLSWWFSYKKVEPLVKRLSPDRRAAFKKLVFVNKDVGECVDQWPYPTPSQPEIDKTDLDFFDDISIEPPETPDSLEEYSLRSHNLRFCCGELNDCSKIYRQKTELDRLFDEYRFIGFDRAFRELSQRLGGAGDPESRRNIFLVLVSKAGGRGECVEKVLGVMARHVNEPANLRAAVVRSLVKRAGVWRLPGAAWGSLLAFGRGLGLDGGAAEAECREGLHAVVLRHLLSGTECDPAVRDAFLEKFSSLSDYSLASDERPRVVDGLTRLLTTAAEKSEPNIAARHLQNLLDVYNAYKMRIDPKCVVPAVRCLAERDLNVAKGLLSPLYEARVARKELFLINLEVRQDAASYLNVLRHDPSAFSPDRLIEQLVNSDDNDDDDKTVVNRDPKHFDRFSQKLSLYFYEDLAVQFLLAIKAKIAEKPDARLARPLASVIGRDMKPYLETFDAATEDVAVRRIAAALRACGYRCRPQLDIDAFEFKNIGAKAVAARVLACRDVEVDKYVNKLLSWRRTVRVAIVLAQRTGHEAETFAAAAKLRPLVAIKTALPYLRSRGDNADSQVWEVVKPLILALNVTPEERIYKSLNRLKSMPSTIRYDYIVTLFFTFIKNKNNFTMWSLHIDLQKYLPDINKESIERILLTLLEKKDNIQSHLYPSIFIRYLLLCETEEEQINRFQKIGRPFLEQVETLLSTNQTFLFGNYLKLICMSLRYNRVCFDTKYVSYLPVCENIIIWMKKFLPMEKYFNEYVQIHLSMLYLKAVRQSIQESPEVFEDSKRKMDEGVSIVGITFGKNIAKELRDLMSTYFDSIVELYIRPLETYLIAYLGYGRSKLPFVGALIQGIIVESVGSEFRLAVHIVEEHKYLIDEATRKELSNILSEKSEMARLFLYAVLRDFPMDSD